MQLKIRRNNLKTFSKQSLKDKSHKELFVIFSVDANSINGRTASHKETESLHQSVVERIDVINRVLDWRRFEGQISADSVSAARPDSDLFSWQRVKNLLAKKKP